MTHPLNTHSECSLSDNDMISSSVPITVGELCALVHQAWDVDFLFDESGLIKGRSNTNVIEKDHPDRHVVRIHSKTADKRLLSSLYDMLHAIYLQGYTKIPIPCALCHPISDTPWIVSRKERLLSLFVYRQGHTLPLWETPSRPLLKEIARNCRELNQALSAVTCSPEEPFLDFETKQRNYLQLITASTEWQGRQESIRDELAHHFDTFVRNAYQLLADAALLCQGLRKQLIHGDIHQENLLFEKAQEEFPSLVCFLDFEEVTIGCAEMDVIFSALRLCKTDKTNPCLNINQSEVLYFLESYDPLLREFYEKNLPFWHAYFALQQSLLYMNHAFYGEWRLTKENGFLQCFNCVVNYTQKICVIE